MAYQNNIPQATDQLSKSQGDILGNFQIIQTWADVNHVDFNAGADAGKHKFITFPVQGAAPSFNIGEVGLYNLLPVSAPITGTDELFITKSNGTTIPITASLGSTSNGWTYFPSGTILQWNQGVSVPASGNNVVSLPNASSQPRFTNIWTVMLSLPVGSANGIAKFAASNVVSNPQTITINCSVAGMVVGYLIIGN